MVNRDMLHTKRAGTIAIKVLVNGNLSYIHISKVHYCPEMKSNLLSLGSFLAKGCQFKIKDSVLNIKDLAGDIVLQSKLKSTMFPLLQPRTINHFRTPAVIHGSKEKDRKKTSRYSGSGGRFRPDQPKPTSGGRFQSKQPTSGSGGDTNVLNQVRTWTRWTDTSPYHMDPTDCWRKQPTCRA